MAWNKIVSKYANDKLLLGVFNVYTCTWWNDKIYDIEWIYDIVSMRYIVILSRQGIGINQKLGYSPLGSIYPR